jgi:putative endonuclease
MAYTVYILQSERDGSFYIGYTACLEKRLNRHNEGRGRYTKTKIPWKMIYQEEFLTRSQAMEREKELKKQKSHVYIEQLVRAVGIQVGKVVPT